MGVIKAFFNQECVIRHFDHLGDGEPIYGKEEVRACRLQDGLHLATTYKSPSGQIDQVVARAKLFCEGDKIPTSSIVICDDSEYIVVGCYPAMGFVPNHQEVYLM